MTTTSRDETGAGTNEVVIVGSGPTGMMLAGELALAGVEAVVLERRESQELVGSRAGGFHSRVLEILDQRGIAERFVSEGLVAQAAMFASTVLDVSDFPTRFPHSLGLWQNHVERIMLGWVTELGVRVRRGVEVTGLDQDDDGVDVHLVGGERLRASYVVGADGGRSVVRRAAGIDFVGWDATTSNLIAEVEVTEEIPGGIRHDETGIHGLNLMEDGRTVRVIVTEQRLGAATQPTMADLSEALRVVFGTDFGIHHPTWISRFTDATRQAVAYRAGRVLLAGDSAHIHSPSGGQGIGLGVQDAVNLGWKLARVVRGTAPEALLDSYHDERHPADARGIRHTMAQSLVQRGDPRVVALRETLDGMLGYDGPRRLVAGTISGLDVVYDLGGGDCGGDGHPLLGRRMPDRDLVTTGGPTRVYALMHEARPLLLDLGAGLGESVLGAWAEEVRYVAADSPGPWELPVVGEVAAPGAVLVRPDGHVAWVGSDGPGDSSHGLPEALARWCGPGGSG